VQQALPHIEGEGLGVGRVAMHAIDLTNHETDYLKQLLEAAHKELQHELHHASNQEFKEGLKRQLDLNEKLRARMEEKLPVPAQAR
jgi:hypothetical protein